MSRYEVRQFDPRRQWLFLVVAVILLVAVAIAFYKFGLYRSGLDFSGQKDRIELLNDQLSDTRDRIEELLAENAIVRRAQEFEAASLLVAKEDMSSLQQEMVTLREELVFYQSLLSPADRKPGLYVQAFDIDETEVGVYHYTLVLTQVRQNDRFAIGKVVLGVPEAVPEDDVDAEELKSHEITHLLDEQPFKFKFFQRIEGRLLIPEGGSISQLAINIEPIGTRLSDAAQLFQWEDLLRGHE